MILFGPSSKTAHEAWYSIHGGTTGSGEAALRRQTPLAANANVVHALVALAVSAPYASVTTMPRIKEKNLNVSKKCSFLTTHTHERWAEGGEFLIPLMPSHLPPVFLLL
jgi:hypothetical protein